MNAFMVTVERAVRPVQAGPKKLLRMREADGDGVLVHGLRGQPSNHRHAESFRKQVLAAYRQRYADIGPTFACEKLAAEEKLKVGVETLRK